MIAALLNGLQMADRFDPAFATSLETHKAVYHIIVDVLNAARRDIGRTQAVNGIRHCAEARLQSSVQLVDRITRALRNNLNGTFA
ncbi:hypothetical protein [uncultured Novosphingobium sp.]|uniref:hypothetical protein n=1 Tax=uncultured Novosphingobium sp. TaxID=292277 RepID=UPI00258D8EB4|nr:hypothetical protein [uncultured Novosphingobium sp.]